MEKRTTDITLRPARPEDAAGIAEVSYLAWRAAYADLLPSEMIEARRPDERRIAAWRERIKKNRFCYVAETENKKITAFAWGELADTPRLPWPGQLHALYVLPEYQKQGLGRRLLEKFRQYVDGAPFCLYMLARNSAAGFYRHMGGTRRPEYDKTEHWQGVSVNLELFLFNNEKKS